MLERLQSLNGALFVASLLLVAMSFAPGSFLLLVVRPGTPSSVRAPVVRPGAPSKRIGSIDYFQPAFTCLQENKQSIKLNDKSSSKALPTVFACCASKQPDREIGPLQFDV